MRFPGRFALPAALVAAGALTSTAGADGSRTFDTTVALPCNIDTRTQPVVRQPLPLSLRLRGTTDEYAAPGATVSFSNMSASLVFPPEAAAAIGRFGADTIGGIVSSLVLYSDFDPHFGYLITPEQSRQVSFPTTKLSATSATEIPLTGPDLNSTAGPIGIGDQRTVSVLDIGGAAALSSSDDPASADVSLSTNRAYDLGCFSNDYTTVVTSYPGPPIVNLPVITRVFGRAVPRIGGPALVLGERLRGTTGVTVGGKRAAFLQLTPKQLLITAPPLPRGSYPVVVTTPSGTSAPSDAATLTYGAPTR